MSRQRGFTLIELLLALGAFAAVGVALGSALRAGFAAWKAGEERARLVQEARRSLEDLGVELRNAVDVPGRAFEGGPDRLAFDTRPAGPAPALARVAYEADPVGKGVARSVEPYAAPPSSRALGELSSRLQFAYAHRDPDKKDSTLWREAWDEKKGRPRGVRATLILVDREGQAHEFVKTVWLPGGGLP